MTYGDGQGQAQGKDPVDWVKDLFVHTPIGLAVMAWKRMPEFVNSVPDLVGQAVAKGCAQLAGAEERISEEVRKARMIGEVAVTFGGRQLRREVDARLRDAKQAAEGLTSFLPNKAGERPNGTGAGDVTTVTAAPSSAAATPPSSAAAMPPSSAAAKPKTSPAAKPASKPKATRKPAAKATGARKATKSAAKSAGAKSTGAKPAATKSAGTKAAGATKARRAAAGAAASAADLPIQEYEGLSASQVVSRLSGLTPEELRAIRSYEEGSRGRRTVLVAIDRLLN